MNGWRRWLWSCVVIAVPVALGLGCSAGDGGPGATSTGGGMSAGGGAPNAGGFSFGGATVSDCAAGQCTDFPAAPISDSGAPSNAATLFGDPSAGSGSGPCVIEPQDGSLLPRNWWRPRFRFSATSGNLFEIRLTHPMEKNALVVYTTASIWTMPKDVWTGLAGHAAGREPVTVVVRALDSASPSTPTRTQTSFQIAPVEAGGSMVYWATTGVSDDGASSRLVGFGVGEEGTVDALTIPVVKESGLFNEDGTPKIARGAAPAGHVSCIGCHSSTPDGDAVAFNDGWPWAGIVASVEKGTVGQRPSYVTDVGARAIQQPFVGAFSFSKGYWGDGKRIAISSYGDPTLGIGWTGANRNIGPRAELAWFDLAAAGTVGTDGPSVSTTITGLKGTAWDFIPRTGDSRAAVNPDWSHDGKTIAYTSTAQQAGGHNGGLDATTGITPLTSPTESDLYTMPFSKTGGAAKPVAGASQAGVAEYYPDFSADDHYLAFNRVNSITGYFYYRANGEIWVVPASGGDAIRLNANDPPQCAGQSSPGIINSWPKWSPFVETGSDGTKYYWLIFSSARKFPEQFNLTPDQWTPTGMDMRASQLYLAAMTVDSAGKVKTYPAVYIWNQTTNTSNLTPAWDEFKIPPVQLH